MNRRGQALIEFVLILPIFLLILFVVVDFGIILTNRNNMESISTDIVREIKNGKNRDIIINEYKDVSVSVDNYKDNYLKVTITKNIRVNTPGLDRMLGNPYKIKVERVIPRDE